MCSTVAGFAPGTTSGTVVVTWLSAASDTASARPRTRGATRCASVVSDVIVANRTTTSLKQSWRKVLEVATPGLPLMIGAGRLIEDVLNVRVLQRFVQVLQPGPHALGLLSPDAQPEQVHLLPERRRIRKGAVVIRLWIERLPAEHAACATESADVRKRFEMIQRDLEGLHAAHREAGHRAMIAVREGAEGGIDKRNERLRHVVAECGGHVLHRLQPVRRAGGCGVEIA